MMLWHVLTALIFCSACGAGANVFAQKSEVKVLPPAVSSAPVDRPKDEDLRRLLGAMRIVEDELRSFDPLIERYKRSAPQVPAKVWDEVKKEIEAEFDAETILRMYLPIYARHFTGAEVKQLIAFFESPAGKKFTQEMPLIQTEAYLSGFQRGQEIGRRIKDRLKAKGYDIPVA